MEMEWSEESDGNSEGARLINAALNQNLRFSNFMITLSTNVVPETDDEQDALTAWLIIQTQELFNNWNMLNGTVLKPAGSNNDMGYKFPNNHKIKSVRSKIAVEKGGAQRGQMHAHVLLEVAHTYTRQEHGAEGIGYDRGRANLGVHVNVRTIRDFLNGQIHTMDITEGRKPSKIYVNSKLLTKGTDNSNKWLTLQYINKDIARDNGGGMRNLRFDEGMTHDPDASRTRQILLHGGLERGPETHNVEPVGADEEYDWRNDPNLNLGGPLPVPEAPAFIRTTSNAVPPQMTNVTSTANIGLKRFNRGKGPSRYKE